MVSTHGCISDYEGWHNKEFIDNGEFTLEFGNFEVEITVPSDHIVAATGEIANANEVLSRKIRNRLREASKSDVPIFIVDPNEAYENELEKSNELKTWKFKADNVRDFAWASSRKFIWDAAGFQQDEKNNPVVMAMSFYLMKVSLCGQNIQLKQLCIPWKSTRSIHSLILTQPRRVLMGQLVEWSIQ